MPEEEVSPYPLATEPDEEAEEEFDGFEGDLDYL